jgi:hypothetical protein
MAQRKRSWQVRRQFLVDPHNWSRWDQAYQVLLLVTKNKPTRKEEAYESRQLRAGVHAPSSAVADD